MFQYHFDRSPTSYVRPIFRERKFIKLIYREIIMFGKNVFHRSRSADFEDSGSRRSSFGLARGLFNGMFSICISQIDRNVVQPLVSTTDDEVQQEVVTVEAQCGKDETASPKTSHQFKISTKEKAQEENNCDEDRSKNMMSKTSNPAYSAPEGRF